LYYFHKKLKILKTQKTPPKKTFLVGLFWVGFLLPILVLGGGGCRRGGDGGGHQQHGLPHLRAGGNPL
jgi:hypothetical protein